MTPRAWPIWTSGTWLVGFMWDTTKHCYIRNIIYKLWVSEEDLFFLVFSHYKSNEPRDLTNLDPRGMVGRIYIGDHLTLLHAKNLSSGPHSFREDDFEDYLAVLFDINK